MVDEGCDTVAIDDVHAVIKTEEICIGIILVELIGTLASNAWPRVLDHVETFFNGSSCENTGSVNIRGSDNKAHTTSNTSQRIGLYQVYRGIAFIESVQG
jgi:hypothetical protein